MEKQKVTLSIPKALLKQAKLIAARQDKSLSQLLKESLKWHVVVINGEAILDAIDISSRYRYSFWDAMIIESAIRGGAGILMTDDLHDGQEISGMVIENPFV